MPANNERKSLKTVIIRAFDHSEADYEAWVALDNQIWTDYVSTIQARRHWAKTVSKKAKWRWWMAEKDGQLLGTANHGLYLYNTRPGSFLVTINVAPEARNQGLGSQLYDHCLIQMQAEHNEIHVINGFTKEDMLDSLRFLENRGFARVLREPLSLLKVQDFDPSSLQIKAQRTEEAGISVRTLAELRDDFMDWKEQYYRLEIEVRAEVPNADPFRAPTFEEFSQRHFADPEFDPKTVWIALRGREWLGMTEFFVSDADPKKGHTGLTGVRLAARRRGVATALKLKSLVYAQECGLEVIQTDNEENNPMFQINLAFGFKPIPARLHYRKKFFSEM